MTATMTVEVATTQRSEADRAVGVILLAFTTDPVTRWAFPDPHVFLTYFPRVIQAFGGKAFDHRTGHHLSGYAGAALWLPPGVLPDEEALEAVFQAGVAESRQPDMFGLLERMGGYHPDEPHWYLPLIGVDPVHQRRGYGSALLQHALAQCDREHKPAYLESSNPANIPLYRRHGFEIVDTIQVGSSPPLFPMLRPAR